MMFHRIRFVLVSTSLLSLLLLTTLPGCGGGDDPVTPGDGNDWETITETSVGTDGGTVSGAGLDLVVPAGAWSEDADITVAAGGGITEPAGADLTGLTDPLRVSGIPLSTEPLELSIAFDPGALAATDSCYVTLEEPVYVNFDGGPQTRTRHLPAVVDRTAGLATVTLPANVAAGLKIAPGLTDDYRTFVAYLSSSGQWRAEALASYFRVYWNSGDVDAVWVAAVIQELEAAEQALQDLGLTFCRPDGDYIDVYVRTLKPGRFGEFVQVGQSIADSYLALSPTMTTGDTMRATCGHELFHFLQMCYGIKCSRWGYQWLWIADALSIWFEPVYLQDASWIPSPQYDARKEIQNALETDTQDHGYGSGRFLTFLTERYGNGIIAEIMNEVAEADNATAAIATVLAAHSASLQAEFMLFAHAYLSVDSNYPPWTLPDATTYFLTPTTQAITVDQAMPDLSARHYLTRLNYGTQTPPTGNLTVSLQDNPSSYVGAAIYTSTVAGGPWTLAGIATAGQPYVLNNFGQGGNVWAKTILTQTRAVAPYDGSEDVTLNLEFAEAEVFDFVSVDLHATYEAHMADSSVRPEQGLNSMESHLGTLNGNTFTANWDSTNSNVRYQGSLEMTVNPATETIVSWTWTHRTTHLWDGSYNEYWCNGAGLQGIAYQNDSYYLFEAYDSAVCDVVSSMGYRAFDGNEITAAVSSHACNDQSDIRFYLRKATSP